eukprot:COSAG02_NODE_16650_length_1067_cov_1.104339_1_plen_225_part_10
MGGAEPGDSREINIASEPTRFEVIPVARQKDILSASIRGGDFMQLYQRQSQSYLHVDDSGNLQLVVPESRLSSANLNAASVGDVVTARADMTWQIEVPKMRWSGAALQGSTADNHSFYNVKEPMSGLYLRQDSDLNLQLVDDSTDEASQWEVVSPDNSGEYHYETTTFFVQNRVTRRILHRSENRPTADANVFSVDALHENSVNHDDLFVCRQLADSVLRTFRDT